MVLLAGIECYREAANVVIYDTDLKAEILNYKLKAIDPNDHAAISLLFQPFQFHQNMDVCCISLENIYDNQFRKNLINIAKSAGFKNVKIIDWCSSLYCYLLSLAEYSLKPNENVWLFYELPENGVKNIYIWKKAKNNAYLCQIIPYIDSISYLENILQSSAKSHKPSLILYPNNFNCFQNLKTIFTMSEIFVYGTIRHVKGALVKARILAKDPTYEVYNATPVLDKDIKVDYNKEQILSFYMFENLPSIKSAEVIEGGGNVEVLINGTSNNYPIPVGITKLTVRIDMDGIVNLDFKNQNNKQQKKQHPKNLSAGNPKPPKPPKTPKTNKATNLTPSSSTTAPGSLKEGGKKKQPKNVQQLQNNITVNVNNNPATSQKPPKQPNLNKNRPRKSQTAATAPEAQAQAQAQAPVNVFVSYQPDQRLMQQPQCYPAFVPMAPTAMPQLQPQQQFYPQPFLQPQMQSMQHPPKQERRPRQKQQHQQQHHQLQQQQYPTQYYDTPSPAPPPYYQATNYPQQNFQPLLTNPLFSMDSVNSNPAPQNNTPTKEGAKKKNAKKQ